MELGGKVALIVGAGSGLSASLARVFAAQGMRLALASRRPDRLEALAAETGALAFECEASDPVAVPTLFGAVDEALGEPSLVVFNPSARTRGPVIELNPTDVARGLAVTALGGFLVGQQAARRMLARGEGAILFTGASASVKGYARSSSFAMGKFALRGLAQSMARELAPEGVHVAHFVIDGAIGPAGGENEAMLDPDAIALNYLHVARQPRSAWTWEVELRPSVESF